MMKKRFPKGTLRVSSNVGLESGLPNIPRSRSNSSDIGPSRSDNTNSTNKSSDRFGRKSSFAFNKSRTSSSSSNNQKTQQVHAVDHPPQSLNAEDSSSSAIASTASFTDSEIINNASMTISETASFEEGSSHRTNTARLRLPALITPTNIIHSNQQQSTQSAIGTSTMTQPHSSGGGGAAAFFRRVTPRRNRNSKSSSSSGAFSTSVLGIQATTYKPNQSKGSFVTAADGDNKESLYCVSPSYEDLEDGDSIDDDDDDDEGMFDSVNDEDHHSKESCTSETQSSGNTSNVSDPRVDGVSCTTSPRLGITKPNYTMSTDIQDDGILSVVSGQQPHVEQKQQETKRDLSERAMVSASDSAREIIDDTSDCDEEKKEDSLLYSPEKITCSSTYDGSIEMTYKSSDLALQLLSNPNIIPLSPCASEAGSNVCSPGKIFRPKSESSPTRAAATGNRQQPHDRYMPSLTDQREAAATLADTLQEARSSLESTSSGRSSRHSHSHAKVMWTKPASSIASASSSMSSSIKSRASAKTNHSLASGSSCASAATNIKIFVLLLQPDSKIFELIQLIYPAETTTVGDILDMIPKNATEPVLARQTYVAVTRPKKKSPDFSDRMYLASASTSVTCNPRFQKSFPDIGLVAGEIILAIPDGYTHYEIVRLGKKILANPRIQKLLEKSNTTKSQSSTTSSKSKQRQGHYHNFTSSMSMKNNSSNSTRSLEKVAEESLEEDSVTGVCSPDKKRRPKNSSSSVTSASTTVSWKSQPGALDSYLSDTSSRLSRREQKQPKRTQPIESVWSPGTAGTHESLLEAYLSDSSKHRRSREQRRSQNTPGRTGPSKTTSSTYPGMLDAYLNPHGSANNSFASLSSPSRSLQRDEQGSRPSILQKSSSIRTVENDNASIADDVSQSTSWSNRSASSSVQHKRRKEFASLTSNRRSVGSLVSLTNASAATDFLQLGITGKTRQQKLRNKKFYVGMAKLLMALMLTLVVRFYLDPNGRAALLEARRAIREQDSNKYWGAWEYDQPMGLLGAIQFALIFHCLVQWQRTVEESMQV